jgi:hypothetical protein
MSYCVREGFTYICDANNFLIPFTDEQVAWHGNTEACR